MIAMVRNVVYRLSFVNNIAMYTKSNLSTVILEYNLLQIYHPLFGLMQRIRHVKVNNYIGNIVRNYDDKDFIMHFRLSRPIVYELMNKFSISPIFTSIEGKYIFLIME